MGGVWGVPGGNTLTPREEERGRGVDDVAVTWQEFLDIVCLCRAVSLVFFVRCVGEQVRGSEQSRWGVCLLSSSGVYLWRAKVQHRNFPGAMPGKDALQKSDSKGSGV